MADTNTWTPIDDPTAFQDDAVFEIDKTTKTIQVLVEQPIVAGENKSQFIKFQMGRYYDAIDLTQMEINVLYESPTGYQDISSAVNREYSDEYIRFGWLVPYAACPEKGTLSFAVEFVGEDYVLKTTRGSTPVLDSIAGSSSVPEPVEQTWYIELQSQVAAAINNANSTLEAVTELIETFQGDIGEAISDWLDNHPEATTTVQDGAITEAKLAEALKLKTIKDYVTPEMYGAVGDGVTDDSAAINAILADGKLLYLPYGKSYLCESDIATPQDGVFTICGFGTLLLSDASLILQNYSTTQTRDLKISEVYGITVKELQQNSEKPCIHIVNGSRINMHDIMVYDGFYGIKIESGLGINIHDIRIDNSFVDSKVRTGLYIDSGDSSFSNIVIREYKIGIDEGFGSNFLYKIHCWIEDFSTVYPDSIGYKLRASRGSYTAIYSAYIDSYETPIKKTGLSFDKFYSCKILNHPSNTTKHAVFSSDYPQARISFDILSVGYNADNYFSIPHNCIIDNVCGIEGFNNLNLNQVSLASGFTGTVTGRLTNAGLSLNGYFSADSQVSANTPVILFNGETSGYSFALMETHLRCVNATGDAQCFLKRNYSSLVSEGTIVNGKTFYVNAFIPISNRI